MQQKYDNLASTVDQLVAVRNRRSMGSPSHAAEGRPKSSELTLKGFSYNLGHACLRVAHADTYVPKAKFLITPPTGCLKKTWTFFENAITPSFMEETFPNFLWL